MKSTVRRVIPLALMLCVGCSKTREPDATAAPSAASTPPAPSAASVPPAPSATPAAAAPAASSPSPLGVLTPPPTSADTIVAQHVLIAYRGAKRAPKGVTRSRAEAKARAQEALAKVRSGTAFEDVVDTYSDDTGSVGRLGSVGKFHRDDMDPAFSKAAFALKVEQVSDVTETPFGFHIIKRTQ